MKKEKKSIKKLLRSWASEAYRRELEKELMVLHDHFHEWEKGQLNPFDLSHEIHLFHDGPARQLYLRYDGRADYEVVVGAINLRIITKEELEPELLDELAETLSYLERRADDDC